MSKILIDLSEYKNRTVELDIQMLKEIFDELDNWKTPTKYKVLEYFPPENIEKQKNYSPIAYEIINLILEYEGGIAYFDGYLDDEDTTLLNQMSEKDIIRGLNMLAIDSIIMITIHNKVITISTEDGYIKILY